MKITGVETTLGNSIIDFLHAQRWQKVEEYSPLCCDKGIDYDCLVFENGQGQLCLEWTNWDEWTITGDETCVGIIREKFPNLR